MSNKDKVELAAAYALDTVTPEERAEVDEILAGSDTDSYELAVNLEEFTQTATRLGLAAAPVEPPASLKASLLAAIATTPQITPTQDSDPADASTTAVQEPGDIHPIADAPQLAVDVDASRTPGGPKADEAQRRWFSRPAAVLTSVAAAAVLVVGGVFAVQAIVPTAPSGPAAVLAQLYEAPDLGKATAELAQGGSATLVYSAELGRSALLVDGLEELPEGKTYELWYINEANGAVPAGTFEPSSGGASVQVLDGSFTPGDVVGVTVEPEGGSEQPTTDPILAVQSV